MWGELGRRGVGEIDAYYNAYCPVKRSAVFRNTTLGGISLFFILFSFIATGSFFFLAIVFIFPLIFFTFRSLGKNINQKSGIPLKLYKTPKFSTNSNSIFQSEPQEVIDT